MEKTIGLAGDVYILREGPTDPFRHVGLGDLDFAFANLEGSLATVTEEQRFVRPWSKQTGFKMNPAIVEDLKVFSAISIANNHAFDFGAAAYLQEIETLDHACVAHAGGGRNRSEARLPVYINGEGLSIAFLAYTCVFIDPADATDTHPGMATVHVHTTYEMPRRGFEQPGSPAVIRTFSDEADKAQVVSDVAAARAKADVVIVSMHWGVNGSKQVTDYQRELGRTCIDAGAALVFGHHPHVLQQIEFYEGHPICYSLGNFLFDGDRHSFDGKTAVIKAYVSEGEIRTLGIIPVIPNAEKNPTPSGAEAAREILGVLIPEHHFDQDSDFEQRTEYLVDVK